MATHHRAFHQLRRMALTTNANATATTDSTPDTSIAPYATALNGVNQPLNNLLKDILWWSLGVLAIIILITRCVERFQRHYRHLAAMTIPGKHQTYWARNEGIWWKFKKYILYAPLWNKRHNREFRISSAVNVGTLPSRLHTVLLSLYLFSNIAFCLAVNFKESNRYEVVAELRGRTGVLAVCNMIALVIFAGRNNPLISMLQISFDTYNLLHRWMGRIVVLEAVVHTIAWAYVKHAATGWSGVGSMLVTDPFISYGTVGTVAMILILLTSPSPLRHAFYETFLDVHIILAFAAMIGVYVHCRISNLPQSPYILATMLLWLGDRLARMFRIVYINYSRREWTEASIEPLAGDACRVTMHLPKYVGVKPGTHAYLRFATLNVWESHPFSIAWVVHHANAPIRTEKQLEAQGNERLDKALAVTDVSFIIHAQTGLTRRLFDAAKSCGSKTLRLKAVMEGPYAGHHSLDSYGHAVLFAGSSGISHQIPYIKHLIQGYTDGVVATRRILLVWIIRDASHLEWVRPWMDEILGMPDRRELLQIKLFITRPDNPKDVNSPSTKVQMKPGRPNIKRLLAEEVQNQTGAMCVTVCGPGGLADNVREAVRDEQENGVVDFIEESFTW